MIGSIVSGGGQKTEVRLLADIGTQAALSGNGVNQTVTASSDGYATFKVGKSGDYQATYTRNGVQYTAPVTVTMKETVYPFSLGPTLEASGWSEISALSKSGQAQKFVKLGDTKSIAVNGITYPARIIGFGHDDLTSGGKAGITFQLVNCLNDMYPMERSGTNANGWEGCYMRKSVMADVYGQLDDELQSVIRTVNKLTSAGNQSSTILTSYDKLFLLSEIEIFGRTGGSIPGEGNQYAWYKNGNSTIKKVDNTVNYWWTRSPLNSRSDIFLRVNKSGNSSTDIANYSYGTSFAFCV